MSTCARTAAPIDIERAASDPSWAAANAVRLWAGWARPETVLVEAAPECTPAVVAALPVLTEQGS